MNKMTLTTANSNQNEVKLLLSVSVRLDNFSEVTTGQAQSPRHHLWGLLQTNISPAAQTTASKH